MQRQSGKQRERPTRKLSKTKHQKLRKQEDLLHLIPKVKMILNKKNVNCVGKLMMDQTPVISLDATYANVGTALIHALKWRLTCRSTTV